MKTPTKSQAPPVAELHELLDERDWLRSQPDGEWNRAALRAVGFLIKVRRGTVGDMVLTAWQHDVLTAHLTAELTNR